MIDQVVFWLGNLARAEVQLERARDEARAAARRAALGQGLADELGGEAVAARASHAAALRAARALETRLREREAALARLRARLSQVHNEREQAALARETAALAAELAAFEDRALAALEGADALGRAAAAAEQRARERRERAAGEAPVAAHDEARAQARLTTLAEEVRVCEAQLPSDVATLVRKLRGSVPPPVVELAEGACAGCGARPPLQRVIEVERGRAVLRCQTCGRFLVATG